jgi:hypothetical protein
MIARLTLCCAALIVSGAASALDASLEPRRFYLSQGEWRGTTLTKSGGEIIADVARETSGSQSALFDINGYADLAPTPDSQRRISDARVDAVREELTRDGVTPGEVGVYPADPDGSVPPPPAELATKRVVIVVHY